MDLTRLAVLAAFQRTGSVTRAAEELHYSQPTVSHHLHRLEVETGAVLFTRVGRALVLTSEGERLAQRAAEILGLVARAHSELDAATNLQRGQVALGGFPSAVATLGPHILTQLAVQHPGLSVELRECEPPEAEQLLVEGGIDLALVFTFPGQPHSETVTSEGLGVDPLYLVTPLGSSMQSGARDADGAVPPRALAAFARSPWLAGCERCRTHMVSTCGRAGFAPQITFASDDYVAIQALVAVGHGVTMLPRLALEAHRHPGVEVTPVAGAARNVALLSLGAPPLPPALAATADVVRSVFTAHRGDLVHMPLT